MLADGLAMMYGLDRPPVPTSSPCGERQLDPVFGELAGASFGGGLYRVHTLDAAYDFTEQAEALFPELEGRLACFGYDWLGRQFALDRQRRQGKKHLVLLLDPATAEALEIPATVASLHTEELVHNAEAALALDFYADWREATGDDDFLEPHECVAYDVPLFLGGEDDVTQLGRIDMAAYWSVATGLRQGTLRLRRGTTIHDLDPGA